MYFKDHHDKDYSNGEQIKNKNKKQDTYFKIDDRSNILHGVNTVSLCMF